MLLLLNLCILKNLQSGGLLMTLFGLLRWRTRCASPKPFSYLWLFGCLAGAAAARPIGRPAGAAHGAAAAAGRALAFDAGGGRGRRRAAHDPPHWALCRRLALRTAARPPGHVLLWGGLLLLLLLPLQLLVLLLLVLLLQKLLQVHRVLQRRACELAAAGLCRELLRVLVRYGILRRRCVQLLWRQLLHPRRRWRKLLLLQLLRLLPLRRRRLQVPLRLRRRQPEAAVVDRGILLCRLLLLVLLLSSTGLHQHAIGHVECP